jgi:hypothetical protein
MVASGTFENFNSLPPSQSIQGFSEEFEFLNLVIILHINRDNARKKIFFSQSYFGIS